MEKSSLFYVEEEFKDTEIGRIPKDWEVVRLGEIIMYEKGKKPSVLFAKEERGTLPYLTADSLRTGSFTQWSFEDSWLVKVDEDDPLLIWDGFHCGDAFIGCKGTLSSTMIKIEPKISNLDKHFLYYILKTRFKTLNSQIAGMYLKHVSKFVFNSLKFPLPSLSEQQRIASILSAIDKAIQKTDEVIAKTERLKKGMMQELLTKGIGHKEFKDTEIGRIPKEWKVVDLGEICAFESGKRPKGGAKEKGDILSIGGEHIDDSGYLNLSSPKFVSKAFYNLLQKGILQIGNIIMCKDGAKTGKVAYIRELKSPAAVNEHVFIIRSKKSEVLNQFIFYCLFSFIGQSQIKAFFHGIIGGIISKDLSILKIPLPPLSEQQQIASILSVIDRKLELERNEKSRLERIKKGFMNKLLTGKIRVRVEN